MRSKTSSTAAIVQFYEEDVFAPTDIKKSYVDVFNPSGAATRALPPAAEVLGPAPAPHDAPSYFVPAPAPAPAQSGFYDPTQMATGDDDQYRSGI
ncbi:unnamed protein product [Parnassius apollo]|uniref:(apollo) hypothetical protein n=1 Tax=Parnassius apollo TaxID=110799 RepID=A0A8S3XT92_PARAO|nr:unnamed protein product [Parnassius apollo]